MEYILSAVSSIQGLIFVLSAAGLYIIFELLICHTTLPQRLRFNGYYGCRRYPHLDPLFGYDFFKANANAAAEGRRQEWVRETFAACGKTFETVNWGESQFHTMDCVNFQTILSSNYKSFGVTPSRGPHSIPWLGKGVLTVDGPFWEHSRNLVKPLFLKAQLSDLARFEKHLNRLFGAIPAEGSTVDLQPLFAKMYLDFSTEFLFGESADTLGGSSSKVNAAKFIQSFDQSLYHVKQAQDVPWILRYLSGRTRDWHKPFKQSQSFVDEYVENAIKRDVFATRNDPHDTKDDRSFVFVQELVRQTGSDDREYLRGQMLNVFFPARDTSSMGISIIFFQLSRHPEIWEKLREEILAAPATLTYDSLKTLKYLNATINEALRLISSASVPVRTSLRDCILPSGGGLKGDSPMLVPKGSKVIMHTHAVQRDRSIWGSDADEFIPERWLQGDTNIQQRRAWQYLPFSGGPRICPASQMMLTQFAFIVARFAQNFERIEKRDPVQRFVEEYRITMQSRNGVKVGLIR